MSSPTKHRPETIAEKWHRLTRLAREQGVMLLREHCTGKVFATSVSHPGQIHRLTPKGRGFACSCEGWARWQRCKHVATLFAELGWLPVVDPEPEPPVPVAPASRRPGRMNLTDAELAVLRGQAARLHAERGWPLVDVETGEVIAT